jgi:cyclopropane fatty-acyl-phospholipid synthase-like methyltransferase
MKDSKNFFEHFQHTKPTSIGNKISKYTFKKLFDSLQIKKSDKVLEIGPGKGMFADLCLKNCAEYWAIEPNEKMAQSLEKQGAKVIKSFVPPIPDMPVKFNTVVMIDVLEHLDNMTSALEVAKDVYNLLEKNGKFLICSPDYLNFGKYFYLIDFSHNYLTSHRRLHQLLLNVGFKKISGYYHSGPLTGLSCFIVSFLASCLPFARLGLVFPDNKLLQRAFNAQITLLRRVVVIGQKED